MRSVCGKICCVAAVLMLLLCLPGCLGARTQVQEHIESLGLHYATMTTRNLNASRSFSADLKEGFCFSVSVTVDSGELRLTIGREGEEPIYTGRLTEDRYTFRVYGDPGEYTIRLEGKDFAGSYRIDWAVKQ